MNISGYRIAALIKNAILIREELNCTTPLDSITMFVKVIVGIY
jgi:hypothetical protein